MIHQRNDPRPYVVTRSVGHQKRLWLVDSGATQSVIFADKRQDYMEVPVADSRVSIHGMFGSDRVQSRAFEYRPMGRPVIQGLVMSVQGSRSKAGAGSILGLDYLRRNRIVFDIDGRRLLWAGAGGLSRGGRGVGLATHPVSRHFLLKAIVNGNKVQFIIDTGAAKSLISLKAAHRLGLKYRPSRVMLSGVNRSQSRVYEANDVSLQLSADGEVRTWDFYIHPLKGLLDQLNSGTSLQVDGILGYDFLRRHLHRIDFGRSEVSLK